MKAAWIVGAVAAIALIAAGIWMYRGSILSTTAPPEHAPASTTLAALLASPTPQQCSFSSAEASSTSSGTVYIAHGRVRGNFISVASGRTIESHLIVKEGSSYVWSDALPGGYQMAFDAAALASSTPQSLNPNATLSYACTPWVEDASMFQLPPDISFKAVGAASSPAGAGTDAQAAQCAACAQAPSASIQAQCRAALSCP